MIFKQYYLACLSHASYLIGDESTGRAVVVDPQRDVSQYLADAADSGVTIERVIETHFHADFLSGHLELQGAAGAVISYGSVGETSAEFAIDGLDHGERLVLGDVVLEVRHTPGHTPESISIVVFEHADDVTPYGVLTGGALRAAVHEPTSVALFLTSSKLTPSRRTIRTAPPPRDAAASGSATAATSDRRSRSIDLMR